MTKWSVIYERFKKLAEKTGREKSSSYVMNLIFNADGEVSVELGCYDIAEWPRNLMLGPFNSEREAFDAAEKKIDEAVIIVLNSGSTGTTEAMMLYRHSDLKKVPAEVLVKIQLVNKDKIGFDAIITTKTSRKIGPIRFDFPFNSEAFVLYINEDPRQLIKELITMKSAVGTRLD